MQFCKNGIILNYMKFIARKHKGLRIVIDPRVRIKQMGRSITQSLTGDTKLGLTVEFQNGLYETKDQVVIKALKNHPGYGISYLSDEPGKEANQPVVEAVAAENEKKAFAEELRSVCTFEGCGKKFANEAALNGHMRVHQQQ